ncbi:MAG: EthD domain-containing protein [Deferribacterota bacterium]|nr:EthD domain-containing protein [Deferribacterota bacterium]
MIRLEFVLKKREDIASDKFYEYWLNNHGTLVAKHREALKVQKYIQLHTIDDELNHIFSQQRGTMGPYDGVAELWWNSMEDLVAAFQSQEGQFAASKLLEDEKVFIDHSRSPLWLAYEIPQVNPAGENIFASPDNNVLKLYYPLRHLKTLTLDQAQFYWLCTHGPKVRQHALTAAILRYIQVHRLKDELGPMLGQARRVVDEPFTGHAELWFEHNALLEAITTPEGQKAFSFFLEDEKKFIDFGRSALWLAKEYVIFNYMNM